MSELLNIARARICFVPTYLWALFNSRVLKNRNWWDPIDDHVLLGARPEKWHVATLKADGVTGVVNTCEEYRGPVGGYAEAGIEQLYVPTIDFTHPSREHVDQSVAFIQKHVDQGGRVYVHCKAGRARSATVVVCWLMHAHGYTAKQAQDLVLSKRTHVNPRLIHRPVVRNFESERLAPAAS